MKTGSSNASLAGRDRQRRPTSGLSTFATALAIAVLTTPTAAQTGAALPTVRKSAAEVEEIRANHVGIVTGAPSGVYARLGADMVRLLDDRAGRSLRISAVTGSGSVNNLDDLRNLPGISLAILQGDVLDAYGADRAQHQWLDQNIRYVGRLHGELLHVVVREDLHGADSNGICALAGRRINVGGIGSGTRITAARVFNEILGLGVAFDSASTEEGLAQLAERKVDAVAFVVGPPAPIFATDRAAKTFADQRFAFLPVPASALEKGCPNVAARPKRENTVYEEAALTDETYPQLIPTGGRIPTLAVPAVLAAYRFEDTASPRARATATFIRAYLARGADPQEGFGRSGGGFASQWCGLDLAAPVKQWKRHEAVEEWLGRRRPGETTAVRCRQEAADRGFCASAEGKAAEFRRRIEASANRPNPQDASTMAEFAAFIARECP